MTIRYWKTSKNGSAPVFKTRRIQNNFIGFLLVQYITRRYDHCDIDTLGDAA